MASTKDYISTLNDLVETCKDGAEGFQKAAENVKLSDLKTLFNEYAQQRQKFASELQMEISRIGGDPATGGSVAGAVHRGWMDIKGAFTGKDDHTILEEAERGEDVAIRAYQDALGVDLPSDLRSVVDRQYQIVQQAHRNVRSLRDRAASTTTRETARTL